MAYLENPGHLPDACRIESETGEVTGFRKVHVRLRGGYDTKLAGDPPWPAWADHEPRTRWKSAGRAHPFDIESYEVV